MGASLRLRLGRCVRSRLMRVGVIAWWVGYLGPGGFSWVEWRSIFGEAVVEDLEAAEELWAVSTPARVTFGIAVST